MPFNCMREVSIAMLTRSALSRPRPNTFKTKAIRGKKPIIKPKTITQK